MTSSTLNFVIIYQWGVHRRTSLERAEEFADSMGAWGPEVLESLCTCHFICAFLGTILGPYDDKVLYDAPIIEEAQLDDKLPTPWIFIRGLSNLRVRPVRRSLQNCPRQTP